MGAKNPTQLADLYPSESSSQQQLVKWWELVCRQHGLEPGDLCAFPLQGARTKHNGARMKAEGLRAGLLDLAVFVMRNGYGGLFVEMKTPVGKLTDNQKDFIRRLTQRGYAVQLCRSTNEAIQAIERYLK